MWSERKGDLWDRLVYRVPWALVLFWALIVYAIVERLSDHLTSADVIDAATAAGVLAVGHGVHHAARAHHEKVVAASAGPAGRSPAPPRA